MPSPCLLTDLIRRISQGPGHTFIVSSVTGSSSVPTSAPFGDSKENTHALTHGRYLTLLKEKDRTLRENAFKTLHRGFLAYENTLSELLQGQVQKHSKNTVILLFVSATIV